MLLEGGGKELDVVDLTISDDDDDGNEPLRPVKRVKTGPRLGPNERFACLTTQVFPHLEHAVEVVRKAYPDGYIKAQEVESEVGIILAFFSWLTTCLYVFARQLVKRLTDNAFYAEFHRYNGRISSGFERSLARRAVKVAQDLAALPVRLKRWVWGEYRQLIRDIGISTKTGLCTETVKPSTIEIISSPYHPSSGASEDS